MHLDIEQPDLDPTSKFMRNKSSTDFVKKNIEKTCLRNREP